MHKKLNNIPVKDFVLVFGNIINEYTFNGFIRYTFDENKILLYHSVETLSNWLVKKELQSIKIYSLNALFPIFWYSTDEHTIITPNYINIFEIASSLTINYDGISEFVLYHTPLGSNTFHKEVKRISGVASVVCDKSGIEFDHYNSKTANVSVQEEFKSNIEKQINQIKNRSNAILLSGGSESRINAAAAVKYQINKDFITWGHPENVEYSIALKIAKKLKTNHINIRPDLNALPYDELLLRTGYLANMQYAYRYFIIKQLFEDYGYDSVWTGWGDINGYPSLSHPSELFSNYYLGLYKNEVRMPEGWNKDWLQEAIKSDNQINKDLKTDKSKSTFFNLKSKVLAPLIFGQVLSAENILGNVFPPWFHPDIYSLIMNEEGKNRKLINNKLWRTIWKNDLYFQLVKYYCPKLNYIKNAKGYYPWLVRKKTGLIGLAIASKLKQYESKKLYPFDPVEDKGFLISKLTRIESEKNLIFSRKKIQRIIRRNAEWRGPDIIEYYKLIQIAMFLNR